MVKGIGSPDALAVPLERSNGLNLFGNQTDAIFIAKHIRACILEMGDTSDSIVPCAK